MHIWACRVPSHIESTDPMIHTKLIHNDAIYYESGTILNVSIVVRLQVRKQTPAAPATGVWTLTDH